MFYYTDFIFIFMFIEYIFTIINVDTFFSRWSSKVCLIDTYCGLILTDAKSTA